MTFSQEHMIYTLNSCGPTSSETEPDMRRENTTERDTKSRRIAPLSPPGSLYQKPITNPIYNEANVAVANETNAA